MKQSIKPGFFTRAGNQYLALSEVSRHLNLPAHEITDAVARGDLEIIRISGCKAVALGDLLSFIDQREGAQ